MSFREKEYSLNPKSWRRASDIPPIARDAMQQKMAEQEVIGKVFLWAFGVALVAVPLVVLFTG